MEEDIAIIEPPEEKEVVSVAEIPASEPDQSERLRLENEAFQKHFAALQEELSEIRQRFHIEEPPPPDPVALLTGQVTDLQNNFQQLQQMLSQQQNQQQQPPPQQIQFIQPPQPQQYSFYPQPMYQPPPAIMPAPALPFFSTPSLAPTNTQAPVLNFNGNNK